MKAIALILVVLGMTLLSAFKKVEYYKQANSEKQKQIESMKILLFDIQRDSIVYKMLTDYTYRTKVNTLVKSIPDQDISKLINKYNPRKKAKFQNSLAAKSRKKKDQIYYRSFSYNSFPWATVY